MDHFRDGKIAIAPLQILQDTQDIDEVDKFIHFSYRKEIVQYFEKKQHGNISPNNLFVEAKKVADKKSELCFTTQAKEKYKACHGNLVFVTGQAGIGKTTFSKQLVFEMLDPDKRLFGAEIVFYVRFREVNYKKDMDLLQFLTTGSQIYHNLSVEERRKILNHIKSSEESVYIVLDGFDEAAISETTNQAVCGLDEQEKAETLIVNLIRGDLLPHSKKIITSRPRQLSRLPQDYHNYFIVTIIGLDYDSQVQICQDLCGKDNERKTMILEYISRHPNLRSFCYVPINAILIMRIFFDMEMKKWKYLNTLTDVITRALNVWFLKNGKIQFQAKEIATLAYSGFVEDRYHFEANDLKSAGVNLQTIGLFLTSYSKFELLEGTDVVSYFAHLIWQEVFVALKLRLYSSIDELELVFPKLDSDKYEVVTRFLFGLCNQGTLNKLLKHADREGLNSLDDRKKCKQMLKNLVVDKLKKLRNVEHTKYFTMLPQILEWIYELREDDFTKEAATLLKAEIDIFIECAPSAIHTFNYVLRSREAPLSLLVSSNQFVESEHFDYFFKELRTTIERNEKIQVSIEIKILFQTRNCVAIEQQTITK